MVDNKFSLLIYIFFSFLTTIRFSAADIMELVLKLEKDAATMDVTAVIKDLQDIVAKINDLKSDCGISIELPVLSEVNTDWIKCAKDGNYIFIKKYLFTYIKYYN